jgi:pilus assembly protein CpaF
MRPDRIVVGEVRGGEALDMLMALNTGHEGSLTTVHANSPEDALRRVETLALMAGVALPHRAVREQVASALDLVVHQARRPDGSRRIESVAEVVRVAGGAGTRELYRARSGRPFWRPPAADGRLGRRIGPPDPTEPAASSNDSAESSTEPGDPAVSRPASPERTASSTEPAPG